MDFPYRMDRFLMKAGRKVMTTVYFIGLSQKFFLIAWTWIIYSLEANDPANITAGLTANVTLGIQLSFSIFATFAILLRKEVAEGSTEGRFPEFMWRIFILSFTCPLVLSRLLAFSMYGLLGPAYCIFNGASLFYLWANLGAISQDRLKDRIKERLQKLKRKAPMPAPQPA